MNINANFLYKFKKIVLFSCAICCCFGAMAHTIRWHVGDEVIETTTCDAGDTITPPTVPAMSGQSFSGWRNCRLLEYINFDNGQYIDTGVAVDGTFDTVEYDIKFLIDQASNTFPFGSSISNYYGGAGCPIFANWSNNTARADYFIANNTGSISGGTSINLNEECELSIIVDINTQTISVIENGGSFSSQYSGSIYANSIALGALHYGQYYGFKLSGRIYYFTIKKNGATIKRYQPAQRLSDNAYGFYEMVSGTFVTATGGVFTSGGPAVE